MHIHATRFTKSYTRWGVFTNLFSPSDRRAVGWYVHLHAPFLLIMIYSTEKLFSVSYWGRTGYRSLLSTY